MSSYTVHTLFIFVHKALMLKVIQSTFCDQQLFINLLFKMALRGRTDENKQSMWDVSI